MMGSPLDGCLVNYSWEQLKHDFLKYHSLARRSSELRGFPRWLVAEIVGANQLNTHKRAQVAYRVPQQGLPRRPSRHKHGGAHAKPECKLEVGELVSQEIRNMEPQLAK